MNKFSVFQFDISLAQIKTCFPHYLEREGDSDVLTEEIPECGDYFFCWEHCKVFGTEDKVRNACRYTRVCKMDLATVSSFQWRYHRERESIHTC